MNNTHFVNELYELYLMFYQGCVFCFLRHCESLCRERRSLREFPTSVRSQASFKGNAAVDKLKEGISQVTEKLEWGNNAGGVWMLFFPPFDSLPHKDPFVFFFLVSNSTD